MVVVCYGVLLETVWEIERVCLLAVAFGAAVQEKDCDGARPPESYISARHRLTIYG